MSTDLKNVSHAGGITDVVAFVFKPRKFDDLHFPLHVNSSIFRRLESLFLLTFALYCKFSINQDNFRLNFLAGGTNVHSKVCDISRKFLENKGRLSSKFVLISLHSTVCKSH